MMYKVVHRSIGREYALPDLTPPNVADQERSLRLVKSRFWAVSVLGRSLDLTGKGGPPL